MTEQPLESPELLQKNAERLRELEEDWSELGPIRKIDYHCRFPDRERAERFCTRAKSSGFQVQESRDDYQWHVTASVTILPTATGVTILQEKLESFLEHDDFENESYIDGWSYPPKQRVQFWPSLPNEDAASARAAVLFGQELVEDPLRQGTFSLRFGSPTKPHLTFKIVPSEFLRKARLMRPRDPHPTASAFSQWVYSLYGRADGNEEDVAEGKVAEQDIWQRRRAAVTCNDNRSLRAAGLPWSLIHNGLNLPDREKPNYLSIPSLCVNGAPLRASPDLMYANTDRTEVMIVEIKFSRQELPKNLWPNVWAQLWCYAQLETARNAHKLTVVGEIWGEQWTRGYRVRRGYEPGEALVCLRALVRRDPRAPAFDRFFRELFSIYAGY